MMVVKLKGGLGNQLFQYATARHLAEKHKTELLLDTSALGAGTAAGDAVRTFSLNAFTITAREATPEQIEQAVPFPPRRHKLVQAVRNRLLGDETVRFNPAVLQLPDHTYLNGYWQSPRYFEAIREQLLAELQLREPLPDYGQAIATQMQSCASVAIHIRRGDYASNPKVVREFGQCSISYYTKAIAHTQEHVTNPLLFVFSDDIAWVCEHLPVGDAVFVSDGSLSDAQELWLMSRAQHNIIANSSFSWWGAWLNQNPDKMVVAPEPWFDRAIYDRNLIPDSWQTLPKH
jgi:hypothetical protein